ncbi:predicted protein [Chaetoceros tenuissimus]|uniref:Uncharacterized protein n=1 Tax=Chaetoceros tenuissimus TaxID=426638 RepID=A0AAD3DBX1_9STRA|nr:predicted protein [Chaetoceros tenuissimus]
MNSQGSASKHKKYVSLNMKILSIVVLVSWVGVQSSAKISLRRRKLQKDSEEVDGKWVQLGADLERIWGTTMLGQMREASVDMSDDTAMSSQLEKPRFLSITRIAIP